MNHNRTKEIFANPKGSEHEVLMLCCIDKCLITWNLERVSNIVRERCGGQGYIACNRLGEYISLAHASITAEGDNRVLMTKVIKDLMINIKNKLTTMPELTHCPKN
jgi:acyl-CoA oxidase